MKSAHAGNIANNAYLIAKFLRRKGEDAHAFHFRAEFIMGHPEWEDADFDAELDPFDPPDWGALRFTNGYVRPEWAHYISGLPAPYELPRTALGGPPARIMAATYGNGTVAPRGGLARLLRAGSTAVAARYSTLARRGQLRPEERVQLHALALVRLAVERLASERAERRLLLNDRLRAVIAEKEAITAHSRLSAAGQRVSMHDLAKAPFWASYRPMAADFDLVQLYGLEAIKGVFLPPEKPFVAFEHSTMRSLPFESTVQGRLLALAYKTADYCVITNPDVIGSAKRLGLQHYRFIPHPLDETKYTPAETPLREEILRQTGASLIFLCPTRHEWSNAFDSKRSDRVIRAFAAYCRGTNPRAALVLSRWGRDVRASEALIAQQGIADHVVWRHPMHKLRLLEHYRAADVVLDQFHESVGTFGTVTAEALSCAKPVIMYFNPAIHEWCLPELPPIESALTEDEIEQRLVALANDPALRERVGKASREWVLKWHGWERCAGDHLELYAEVMARSGQRLVGSGQWAVGSGFQREPLTAR
ncbi:MAG: glycosyltransferase [Chloroflexi bacterium]|nr:glycosyltransferase [Chloroflexota bacterium]